MARSPRHHYRKTAPRGGRGPGLPTFSQPDTASPQRATAPFPAQQQEADTEKLYEQFVEENMNRFAQAKNSSDPEALARTTNVIMLASVMQTLDRQKKAMLIIPALKDAKGKDRDSRTLYGMQRPDGSYYYVETSGLTIGWQFTDQVRVGDDGNVYFRGIFPEQAVIQPENLETANVVESPDGKPQRLVYVNMRIKPSDIDPMSWNDWLRRLGKNVKGFDEETGTYVGPRGSFPFG